MSICKIWLESVHPSALPLPLPPPQYKPQFLVWIPASSLLPPLTPYILLFAEKLKQSFKSKSGHLFLHFKASTNCLLLQRNPNPSNSHAEAALANLSSFIPNHSTSYPPSHSPTNLSVPWICSSHSHPRAFALANWAARLLSKFHLVFQISV